MPLTAAACAEIGFAAALDGRARGTSRGALLATCVSIEAALALAARDAAGCRAYAADLARLGPDAIAGLLAAMQADAASLRGLAALVEMGETRLLCGASRFLAETGAR